MAQFVRPIRVNLCLSIFISLCGLIGKDALAASCGTVSGQASITINSSCTDLVLDSAGNVEVSSSVNISGLATENAVLNNTGTTNSITNYGTLHSDRVGGAPDYYSYGIQNNGTIATLNNRTSADISAASTGTNETSTGIWNKTGGTVNTLNNSGSARIFSLTTGNGSSALGIANEGAIGALINSGSAKISAENTDTSANGAAYAIANLNASLTYLTNIDTAKITAVNTGSAIGIHSHNSVITTLTNGYGAEISASSTSADAHGIYNMVSTSLIRTLVNSGTISATSFSSDSGGAAHGISNQGVITTLNNSGLISGKNNFNSDVYGIWNAVDSTITTLTNTGVISATSVGGNTYGIKNAGIISTINNKQGGNSSSTATTALMYNGRLPTNYNIIINSASQYGQLAGTNVTGSTTFGVYAGSLITSRLYTGVLQGLSGGNVGATRTGNYDGMDWTLAISSGTSWDLTFTGTSLVGTQASLQNSAQRMRSIFNTAAISTNFANMNTYDCNLFDTKGMCISAGGRYTTVDNPSANFSSAVVVVGYKATPNIRIGGFLDQNFNNTTPTGIHIANKNPMMGAFAVWNKNEDGTGVQVKVANAYQDKDVTTTRDVIGTSEAGTGSTKLNTQSYVGELSYAFTFKDKTLVRPYLALRHTTIKQDAYTEATTALVTDPLTYAALEDKSTAALLGVKLNHALTPKANLTASLGVEQDLSHKVDQYAASGVSGLTSENFNVNIKHTRPVASLGAYYALTKTQRISGDVYYQQLPFQSTGSTTAYFNYTIGL
jgi:hypothetical protein